MTYRDSFSTNNTQLTKDIITLALFRFMFVVVLFLPEINKLVSSFLPYNRIMPQSIQLFMWKDHVCEFVGNFDFVIFNRKNRVESDKQNVFARQVVKKSTINPSKNVYTVNQMIKE